MRVNAWAEQNQLVFRVGGQILETPAVSVMKAYSTAHRYRKKYLDRPTGAKFKLAHHPGWWFGVWVTYRIYFYLQRGEKRYFIDSSLVYQALVDCWSYLRELK